MKNYAKLFCLFSTLMVPTCFLRRAWVPSYTRDFLSLYNEYIRPCFLSHVVTTNFVSDLHVAHNHCQQLHKTLLSFISIKQNQLVIRQKGGQAARDLRYYILHDHSKTTLFLHKMSIFRSILSYQGHTTSVWSP